MGNIIKIITVSALCVLFAGSAALAQKKAIQVGDKMPGFYLKDMKGDSFFLNEHIGENAKYNNKAMVFSLSASYCKPCMKEIPELGKLLEQYKDKGLGIYLIVLERKKQAQKLITVTQTKLPILLDRYLMVPKLIGRQGIPCTLLVDGEGTVKFINTGFNEKNAAEFIERFEHEVVALLGDDNSGSSE